jgi:hypothetical protein
MGDSETRPYQKRVGEKMTELEALWCHLREDNEHEEGIDMTRNYTPHTMQIFLVYK